jgi:hypothetical protein
LLGVVLSPIHIELGRTESAEDRDQRARDSETSCSNYCGEYSILRQTTVPDLLRFISYTGTLRYKDRLF